MSGAAWFVVGLMLLLLGIWLLTRHIHRWSAWESPVVRVTGRVTQTRRCKDSACNRYQIRDVVR